MIRDTVGVSNPFILNSVEGWADWGRRRLFEAAIISGNRPWFLGDSL